MSKYLDMNGVTKLWGKVKSYVEGSIPTTISWTSITGKPDLALKSDIPSGSGGNSGSSGGGGGSIPSGVIAMWSGSTDAVPSGWALCNGENDTPDLQDRFVLGAGNTYEVGATGGEETHMLLTAEMPSHYHRLFASHGTQQQNTYGHACVNMFESSYNGADTKATGEGKPHNNMPPYYALCFIMKV